jgi:primosomal protein N' (replication factor Y) (superfamily II helicase)
VVDHRWKSARDAQQQQPELFATDAPWELDASRQGWVAVVSLAEAPFGPFDYLVPEPMVGQIRPGVRLRVPLGRGNRLVGGYCLNVSMADLPAGGLKPVAELLDPEPLCDAQLLQLVRWIAAYYRSPIGQVLESVIPAGVRSDAGSQWHTWLHLTEAGRTADDKQLRSPLQRQVLQRLQALEASGEGGIDQQQLLSELACSPSPIDGLLRQGWVERRRLRLPPGTGSRWMPTAGTDPPAALTADQRIALSAIKAAIDSCQHQTLLLHGVTGSGKTEVYMQAIQEVLRLGRQAIVLVPEISLTPQTRQRFQARFGQVAVIHSQLSDVQRHALWRRIASGQVPIVIGPRSAIFAPLPNLGLILLDEEHESSFKQNTLPRYHARDVALQRSAQQRIPLVLGSATPSLESWQRAQSGAYRLLSLPRRILNRPLPTVTNIDMRRHAGFSVGGVISQPLAQALRETLAAGGQAMLMLNRRGFATHIQCTQCGWVANCPDCDMPLTHHREGYRAVCHHCGHQEPTPRRCQQCSAEGLSLSGTGTQRLEEDLQRLLPGVPIGRMDADTMRRAGAYDRLLEQFQSGQLPVLLGTQMIAKGLDFPNVRLVGVIGADAALHFPDFRSAERTFQLVTQVAGRCGRGDAPGEVLVQTFSPEHPAIQAAKTHDFLGFAATELENRRKLAYPPFAYLARIILRGTEAEACDQFAARMAECLKAERKRLGNPGRLLGPAEPAIPRLRGKHRRHLVLLESQAADLHRWLDALERLPKPPGDVQYVVDIDPQDML